MQAPSLGQRDSDDGYPTQEGESEEGEDEDEEEEVKYEPVKSSSKPKTTKISIDYPDSRVVYADDKNLSRTQGYPEFEDEDAEDGEDEYDRGNPGDDSDQAFSDHHEAPSEPRK